MSISTYALPKTSPFPLKIKKKLDTPPPDKKNISTLIPSEVYYRLNDIFLKILKLVWISHWTLIKALKGTYENTVHLEHRDEGNISAEIRHPSRTLQGCQKMRMIFS